MKHQRKHFIYIYIYLLIYLNKGEEYIKVSCCSHYVSKKEQSVLPHVIATCTAVKESESQPVQVHGFHAFSVAKGPIDHEIISIVNVE